MAIPELHRWSHFVGASTVAVLVVFGLFGLIEWLWTPATPVDRRLFFLTRGAIAAAAVGMLALLRSRQRDALHVWENLQAVSRHAIEGFVTVDHHGRILDLNPSAARMFGYGREELIGCLADVLVPHRLRGPWRELREAVLRGDPSSPLDTSIDAAGLRKDGAEFPIELSAAHWTIGRERFFAGIVRDVTEKQRAEAILRESEQRLRNAHALASLGSWEWSPETGEITWSDELFEICGRDPASYRPTVDDTSVRPFPEDAALASRALRRALETTGPVEWEERIVRGDGTVRRMSVRAQTIRSASGRAVKVAGVAQDVTERREAEEAVRAKDREFRLTLENLTDVISIVDPGGMPRYVSSSIERMLGYTASEYVAAARSDPSSALGIFHPDDVSRASAWFQEILTDRDRKRPSKTLVFRARHRDGTWHVLESLGHNFLDERALRGIVITTRDVTERNAAEERLRESEQKFRLLFETSHDAVWIGTPDGRLLDVNAAGVRMLGYESKEEIDAAGLATTTLDPDSLAEAIRAVEEEGGLRDFECDARRRDGTRLRLVINASPVRNERGEISYLHGITRDVTEQRALERRVQQAQKLEAIGRLAAGVAHEVNNPLTWMLSNAQELGEYLERARPRIGDEGFERFARGLADLREGIERVARIVRDLKTFGRVDPDRHALVDPIRVVRRAADMAANEIRFRARLRKELVPSPPVLADEGRLLQVFLNLLVNAAEAIPEGEQAENEIVVSSRRDGGFVCIEVRDTGRGIDSKEMPHLFDAFFTTKGPGEGSGLGLAISHQIVDACGGTIEVESHPGRGSVFSVRLPLADTTAISVERATPETKAPAPRRARVLVIDDEPLIRSVTSRLLRREHEVVEAPSGEEALSLLEDDRDFDVILCDLMMPGIGGRGVYDSLASRSPDLVDRVVFMTGGAFTPGAAKFLEAVPNPRLEKPFEAEQLLAAVTGAMSSF